MTDPEEANVPEEAGARPPICISVLKVLIPLLILSSAGAGVFWIWMLAPREEAAKPVEAPKVNVTALTVQALPEVRDGLDLPAVVEANRVMHVAAEVDGRIERVACEEGSRIKAGEPIIFLNTDLLQAEFNRAKAKVEYDAKQHERIENLMKDGVATAKELDDVAVSLAVSKATLEAAQTRLERSKIAAPVGGIVNDVPVEKGEYVGPGVTVAEIVDIDTVKVVVQVPERDVQFFRTGTEAKLIADINGTQEPITGTITYISSLADEGSRSTRLEISVDNRQRRLRSGQIIRAQLTRRVLKNVIMVPLEAVIPLEVGKAVYVVEDGKAARRKVELGAIKGRDVQILSGLKPGDRLIVAGHRFVGPGQAVEVVGEK